MPRWEPNARVRLVEAALELFEERGYDETSVKEIAARAGLTKTTFFRQFTDKREVLAAGQEEHLDLLARAVADTPMSTSPIEAVERALVALSQTFPPERRAFAARVLAVTAAHDELRERAGLKDAGYVTALREALTARDVPATTAAVAADLGQLAFRTAFARWTAPGQDGSLEDLVHDALAEILAASRELDASPE